MITANPLINKSIATFMIASQLGFASTGLLAAVTIPPLSMSAHLGAADSVTAQNKVTTQDKLTKKSKASKKATKPEALIFDKQANQANQTSQTSQTSQTRLILRTPSNNAPGGLDRNALACDIKAFRAS